MWKNFNFLKKWWKIVLNCENSDPRWKLGKVLKYNGNGEKLWKTMRKDKKCENSEKRRTTFNNSDQKWKNWNCENGEKQNRTTHNKTWQQTTDGKRNLETESAL